MAQLDSQPLMPPSARPRYLVAELEPTTWRVPFEAECRDLETAAGMFTERSQLHMSLFGGLQPMVLLDRETSIVLRSTAVR